MFLRSSLLRTYSDILYHNEELKSLTRYRFDKIQKRAQLKQSIARLANIIFTEIEKLVSSLNISFKKIKMFGLYSVINLILLIKVVII